MRTAKTSLLLATALVSFGTFAVAQETPIEMPQGQNELFSQRVLTTGLSNPWDIVSAPDGKLWVTERSSGEVTKIDRFTGEQQTILTLTDFVTDVQHQGLMGMVLHPEFMKDTGNDFVYLVYTYNAGTPEEPASRSRVARYTYDAAAEALVDPITLIEDIPAGNDHNAGRLIFSPDGQHIFYSIGEQGANYGGNYQKPNRAQWLPTAEDVANGDHTTYSGKILRLNLDGSVPEDNPEIEGVRSHIWTYGHRNPQGLSFGPDGTLYSSEHGPDSDDEINIIQAGGNYGWPNVAGFKDDQAYVFADWSKSDEGQRYTGRSGFPDNIPQFKESEFDKDMVDPIVTMWTVDADYDFTANCGWICNPTIGPSALEYYGEDEIPEWKNSVLVPALKHGVLYVQHLSEDGQSAEGLAEAWFSTQNRYRDVQVVGKEVFIATDGFGTASQKFGDTGFTNVLHNPNSILVFTYGGEQTGGYVPAEGYRDPNATAAATAPAADVSQFASDYETLFEQGQTLFGTTCAACHGAEGQGAQGPGFAGKPELVNDGAYFARTIIKGFGYMPAFETRLDDGQIAAISTFIRNSWGNEAGVLTPAEVQAQR